MAKKQITDCQLEIENHFAEFGNPRFPAIPNHTTTKPITISSKNTDKGEYKGKLKFYVTVKPDGTGYVTLHSYKHGVLGVFHSYDYEDNSDYQVKQELERRIKREQLERERIEHEKAEAKKKAAKALSLKNHLELFPRLNSATPNNAVPYFTKDKQIPFEWLDCVDFRYANDQLLKSCDIRFDKDFIVYRTQDANGTPCSLSRIYDKKDKTAGNNKFAFAGSKRGVGAFLPIATFKLANTILLTESVADGIIVHKAVSNSAVAITEDAGNIRKTLADLTDLHSEKPFVVIADNDDRNNKPHLDNTGIIKAVEAVNAVNYGGMKAKVCWPKNKGDISDIWLKNNRLDDISELVDSAFVPKNGLEWQFEKIAKYVGSNNIDSCVETAIAIIATQYPRKPITPAIERLIQSIEAGYERFFYFFKERYVKGNADNKWTESSVKQAIQAIIERRKKASIQRYNLTEVQKLGIKKEVLTCEQIDRKWRISELSQKQILSKLDGVHIIHVHKDAGKTYSLIKPFIAIGKQGGSFPVVVNNRQALSHKIAKDVELPCYLDVISGKIKIQDCDGLVICINSINNPLFTPIIEKCKLLAIDEVDQVLNDIHGSTVSKYDKQPIWNGLHDMLNNAEKAIVASADVDINTIHDLKVMRKDLTLWAANQVHSTMAGKTFTLFENKNDLRAQYLQDVEQNKATYFAADHRNDTTTIGELVNSKICSKKEGIIIDDKPTTTIVINSKTTEKCADFIDNINDQYSQIQTVIASPSVQAGVSIEVPVDTVYGEYNQEVTAQGFEQMIGRVRNSDNYCLYLAPHGKDIKHDNDNKTKVNEYLRTLVNTSQAELDNALETGELKIKLTEFDKSHIRYLQGQVGARNSNDILLRLEAQGATINAPNELNQQQKQASEVVRVETIEAKQTAKERTLADQTSRIKEVVVEMAKPIIANPTTPTQEEVVMMDRYITSQYENLTPQEKGSSQNYGLRAVARYGFELVKRDIDLAIQLDNDGTFHKIRALKTLLAEKKAIQDHHIVECQTLPVTMLSNVITEARFTRFMLRELGLLTDDGLLNPSAVDSIEYNAKSDNILKIAKHCKQYSDEFTVAFKGWKTITPRLRIGKGGIQFIGNWLKLYGIKQVRYKKATNSRNYGIDKTIYQFIYDGVLRENINPKLLKSNGFIDYEQATSATPTEIVDHNVIANNDLLLQDDKRFLKRALKLVSSLFEKNRIASVYFERYVKNGNYIANMFLWDAIPNLK